MAWSTGIDGFAGEWRVFSARTQLNDLGEGEILFNMVGGRDTRIHAGFEISSANGLRVWAAPTAAGAFAGLEQTSPPLAEGVQPLAKLWVDPVTGASELALTVSSVNSLPQSPADHKHKRVEAQLPDPGSAPVTYALGLTADKEAAARLAANEKNRVFQLFGAEAPLWLHITAV
jgi:hypothetical protein